MPCFSFPSLAPRSVGTCHCPLEIYTPTLPEVFGWENALRGIVHTLDELWNTQNEQLKLKRN